MGRLMSLCELYISKHVERATTDSIANADVDIIGKFTYTGTHTHTHSHTHAHAYMHTHTHAHAYMHTHTHMHAHTVTHTHTHAHAYMHTHTLTHTHTALLLSSQLHNATQLSTWCLHFVSSNYVAFDGKEEFNLLTGDNLEHVQAHRWPPLSYERSMEEYRVKYLEPMEEAESGEENEGGRGLLLLLYCGTTVCGRPCNKETLKRPNVWFIVQIHP